VEGQCINTIRQKNKDVMDCHRICGLANALMVYSIASQLRDGGMPRCNGKETHTIGEIIGDLEDVERDEKENSIHELRQDKATSR